VIEETTMVGMIREIMPDAQIMIVDRNGTMDHFNVSVASKAFAGKSLMDRHRMVEGALKAARNDGRIHALEIKTAILE
jgi:stress-induced morphogen